MSGRPPRGRPGPLLPPADGRGFWLFAAIALLAFAASLAGAGAVFGGHLALGWRDTAATGAATVTLRSRGLETADAAQARAAEVLRGLPAIAKAEPLDPGSGEADDVRAVAVWFKAAATPAADLAGALKAEGLTASVDDHGLLTSPARRAVVLALAAAAGVMILVVSVAAAILALVARRTLAARHEWVSLLRSAGAMDRLISGLPRDRFAAAGALAGLIGGLLAIAACAIWRSLVPTPDGGTVLLWASLAGAAPWPAVMALIGAMTARASAGRMLQRAP